MTLTIYIMDLVRSNRCDENPIRKTPSCEFLCISCQISILAGKRRSQTPVGERIRESTGHARFSLAELTPASRLFRFEGT